ncbi:alpha/beta hydrolase family protein [Actinomadura sp. 6N118]|uniref:alpha/beta hydrolase family protein n=1 Tax=Actinomadura sp. 6N118 TaxID=3375151 RepID=UPI00378AA8D6
MTGEHPNHPDTSRIISGTTAGTAYLALPPTAVDARPAGPTRLLIAWPGFDPPRTSAAFAAAVPLTGVPTWRIYLDLPTANGDPPHALSSGDLLEDAGIERYAAIVEQAATRLPAVLAGLRRDLGVADGPIGLAGFSVGGAAALLTLARGLVPVSTAAVVMPMIAPARAVRFLEKRAGRERAWSSRVRDVADRLDLGTLAGDIAGHGAPLLLIGGAKDRLVPPGEITALRDLLRQHGAEAAESATFRMGHQLTAEPGTDPLPPTTEAVRVDGALSDWFRERLATVGRQPPAQTVAHPPHEAARPSHEPAGHRPAQGPVPLHLEGSKLEAASGIGRRA